MILIVLDGDLGSLFWFYVRLALRVGWERWTLSSLDRVVAYGIGSSGVINIPYLLYRVCLGSPGLYFILPLNSSYLILGRC